MFLAISFALAHKDLEVQVADLTALLQAEPSAELHVRRADLLARLERPDEALADLASAEGLGEDVDLERALVLSESGRTSEALALLDEVLGEDPHWEGHRARARIRLQAGDEAGALQDFDAAVAAHSEPDLVLERGRATTDVTRRADGYLTALEALGPAVVIELAAAEALAEDDRPAEAHAVLSTLIERSGPQPSWLLQRAAVAADPDDAHADRQAALELARSRFEKKPNDLNQLAVEEASAALAAEPGGCSHGPLGGLIAAFLLLWRRRC